MRLIHFYRFSLEKCGKIWKNRPFIGQMWPHWGNTAWADMAGFGSIGLNIYQHYLEAIPTKFLVSTIITSKILISFAVLAKISRWKGGWGNISTPTLRISHLIILLHFDHPPITLKQFEY